MASRLKLHEELCTILGSRNVYFQPPESVKINYPGIVYSIDGASIKRADNSSYRITNKYSITVIDYDPDSILYSKILSQFSSCSLDRTYVADNLNHFVLTLYY